MPKSFERKIQEFIANGYSVGIIRKMAPSWWRKALGRRSQMPEPIFSRWFVQSLRTRYELAKFEPYLEVPLDSYVGKWLRKEPEGSSLPPWKTVKGLTPELNAEFQEVAAEVAKREGIHRVHLDMDYWRRK